MRRDMPDGYRSRAPLADDLLTEAMRLRDQAVALAEAARRVGRLSERVRPVELAAYRAAKTGQAAPDEPEAA